MVQIESNPVERVTLEMYFNWETNLSVCIKFNIQLLLKVFSKLLFIVL